MDDRVLNLRALIAEALEQVDNLVHEDAIGLTPDEMEGLTLSAVLVRRYGARSLREVAAWREALKSGDEAWLLLRSVPGEFRADAWHLPTLKPNVRRQLTGE